jgi:hypothetical protein
MYAKPIYFSNILISGNKSMSRFAPTYATRSDAYNAYTAQINRALASLGLAPKTYRGREITMFINFTRELYGIQPLQNDTSEEQTDRDRKILEALQNVHKSVRLHLTTTDAYHFGVDTVSIFEDRSIFRLYARASGLSV